VSPRAIHGGVRLDEITAAGRTTGQVLDFSVNLSPIGPPAGVRAAVAAADLSSYPDPESAALVAALSERLDLPAECILVGNGATELIHLVTRVFVRQGQRPIVLAPTFGEYAVATELAGGAVYPWQAQAHRGFRWNLKNKPEVLRRVAPPLVFLCNPNNPTGVYLDRNEVRTLANALVSGPLLLDEAYVGFLEEPWNSLDLTGNGRVIVVRSLTKEYALAGLRLGYLVAHPDVISSARRLQPEWSVNVAAQAAGLAALSDEQYLPRMRAVMREGKQALIEELRQLGRPIHEGTVNFVLVEVGDAAAIRAALLSHGFAVRDCTSFGLPNHIRIGIRTATECRMLADALGLVLRERTSAAGGDGRPSVEAGGSACVVSSDAGVSLS
jgi:histidinol-phosphate aminotransferase